MARGFALCGHNGVTRITMSGRNSRPARSRKFTRRKQFEHCRHNQRAKEQQKKQRKHERQGETRPSLNVDVLPPAQNRETVVVHVFILLAMNPVIFTFCWQEVWEPLVFLCVLERVMFVMGILCLCWTFLAAKCWEWEHKLVSSCGLVRYDACHEKCEGSFGASPLLHSLCYSLAPWW